MCSRTRIAYCLVESRFRKVGTRSGWLVLTQTGSVVVQGPDGSAAVAVSPWLACLCVHWATGMWYSRVCGRSWPSVQRRNARWHLAAWRVGTRSSGRVEKNVRLRTAYVTANVQAGGGVPPLELLGVNTSSRLIDVQHRGTGTASCRPVGMGAGSAEWTASMPRQRWRQAPYSRARSCTI